MNLIDLRKFVVKKHLRISFELPNGLQCLLDEHGVARIPELRAIPNFNLEAELPRVERFVIEPTSEKDKPRSLTAKELESLAATTAGSTAAAAHDEE